jgi:hypothetical protein
MVLAHVVDRGTMRGWLSAPRPAPPAETLVGVQVDGATSGRTLTATPWRSSRSARTPDDAHPAPPDLASRVVAAEDALRQLADGPRVRSVGPRLLRIPGHRPRLA